MKAARSSPSGRPQEPPSRITGWCCGPTSRERATGWCWNWCSPQGKKLGEVGLLHGEERRVRLGDATELKLMLLRVDSPEFRALMRLAPSRERGTI